LRLYAEKIYTKLFEMLAYLAIFTVTFRCETSSMPVKFWCRQNRNFDYRRYLFFTCDCRRSCCRRHCDELIE